MKAIIREVSFVQWIVILLLAVWLGWAVTVLWPDSQQEVSVELAHSPDCDLRAGPCISALPTGGEVSFSIEPRNIPLLETLKLQVETTNLSVEKVDVDINGVEMNMGFNRTQLQALGNGRFSGKADLSVCVHEIMEWEAKVLLHQRNQVTSVPFRFITVNENALIAR